MRTVSSDLARHDDGDSLGFARRESAIYESYDDGGRRGRGAWPHKEEAVKPSLQVELQELLARHAQAMTAELRTILPSPTHSNATCTTCRRRRFRRRRRSINQAIEPPEYIPATRCWRCVRCRRFADVQRRAVTAHMASCHGSVPALAPTTPRGSRARTSKNKKP